MVVSCQLTGPWPESTSSGPKMLQFRDNNLDISPIYSFFCDSAKSPVVAFHPRLTKSSLLAPGCKNSHKTAEYAQSNGREKPAQSSQPPKPDIHICTTKTSAILRAGSCCRGENLFHAAIFLSDSSTEN